jgi:plastocyanin domain-containing protein
MPILTLRLSSEPRRIVMELLKRIFGMSSSPARREIEIVVKGGYRPARIELARGERVALEFIRKESSGCSREVVFPDLGIRRELPEGVRVGIELPELEAGSYRFQCGMDMIHGEVTVLP